MTFMGGWLVVRHPRTGIQISSRPWRVKNHLGEKKLACARPAGDRNILYLQTTPIPSDMSDKKSTGPTVFGFTRPTVRHKFSSMEADILKLPEYVLHSEWPWIFSPTSEDVMMIMSEEFRLLTVCTRFIQDLIPHGKRITYNKGADCILLSSTSVCQ